MALMLSSTVSAQDAPGSNPPVFQNIGMLDTVAGSLEEADCRGCHMSGLPDRHHALYDQLVPGSTVVPYPEFNNGDLYTCMSCHSDTFALERDCLQCHNTGSPHHTTQAAVDRQCTACHGDLVDDFDDGHYIPDYAASLVTPWQGLNGDGYFNAPYPTPDLESDGSGAITPADVEETEAGPPYFSVNSTPLGSTQTRNQPNVLAYKPSGFNNDVVIGSTHHGGEEYSVVFNAGSPLAATWDADTQTLSVTIDTSQTATELVSTINTATGTVDVEASLGYDGEDPVADLLPPEHYEPIGGDPPNNRGFGAGSCSYCHDHDGLLDANGDPAPALIVNNHDTHHGIGLPFFVSDGAGGSWRRCNVCHNYTDRAAPDPATYHDQSGPAFDLHIRICEECHGPESLHNIQADSDGGGVVVGGELAGYGHVGRDMGPGDSDCWGCHGFATATASAPLSGPVVPTIYSADSAVVNGGSATSLTLTGAAFTNTMGAVNYSSDVKLTAADGTSVTLAPDVVEPALIGVTIPADTASGNYNVQAVKADMASNPVVISVIPEVSITAATCTAGGGVTITGSGFAGYVEGSGLSVSGKRVTGKGRKDKATATLEASIASWSDTLIEAQFASCPSEATVNALNGTGTAAVVDGDRGGNGGGKKRR
jgi:hypothetical protein